MRSKDVAAYLKVRRHHRALRRAGCPGSFNLSAVLGVIGVPTGPIALPCPREICKALRSSLETLECEMFCAERIT